MDITSQMVLAAGVPKYEVTELRPRRSDYVVFVFVINEGPRIRAQLIEMAKFSTLIDIVVADGGSTDGSLEIGFLKSVNCSALLTKRDHGGLSAQMRMAFRFALEKGYKGVITMDGNGKDGVNGLPSFISLLEDGFDHIQGSRYISGGYHENTPLSRHLALKFLHAPLISWASKTKQTDTTNGFRGYSARLLADNNICVFRNVFQTYELHYHLAIEAGRRADLKTIETPVTRVYPKKGKTPTKISPIRGQFKVLLILLKAVFGMYRVKEANGQEVG